MTLFNIWGTAEKETLLTGRWGRHVRTKWMKLEKLWNCLYPVNTCLSVLETFSQRHVSVSRQVPNQSPASWNAWTHVYNTRWGDRLQNETRFKRRFINVNSADPRRAFIDCLNLRPRDVLLRICSYTFHWGVVQYVFLSEHVMPVWGDITPHVSVRVLWPALDNV